jgi:alpha-ketoglutarate-dependent taurine dioxygenase
MNQLDVKSKWGTVIDFNSPGDFFKTDPMYWRNMLYDRKLLVFKKMNFTKEEYVKLCMCFGKLWNIEDYQYSREQVEPVVMQDKTFAISPISNKISPKLGMNKMPWHADIPNKIEKPFPIRSIWMHTNPNPNSGLTSWMNIEDGISALPAELKSQIDNIKIMQQSWWELDTDIQIFDFIKKHPITDKNSLRLNFFRDENIKNSNAWIKNVFVNGKIQDPKPVLAPFFKYLETQEDLIYTHRWDDFDIIIYDNWPLVHNRTKLEFDTTLERLMYRTNIDHLTELEYKNEYFKI